MGGQTKLYLGHVVGNDRLAVPEVRAQAMARYIKPITKKGLRSFLGSVGYYRKFIPGIADYTAKLTPAISKMAPGGSWDGRCFYSFA